VPSVLYLFQTPLRASGPVPTRPCVCGRLSVGACDTASSGFRGCRCGCVRALRAVLPCRVRPETTDVSMMLEEPFTAPWGCRGASHEWLVVRGRAPSSVAASTAVDAGSGTVPVTSTWNHESRIRLMNFAGMHRQSQCDGSKRGAGPGCPRRAPYLSGRPCAQARQQGQQGSHGHELI
jgi:hypothetical protein